MILIVLAAALTFVIAMYDEITLGGPTDRDEQ
jgi:hypothetical protein